MIYPGEYRAELTDPPHQDSASKPSEGMCGALRTVQCPSCAVECAKVCARFPFIARYAALALLHQALPRSSKA